MPQTIIEKKITCIGCGRTVAEGFMLQGRIKIVCRCGVSNIIEAYKKENAEVKVERFIGQKVVYGVMRGS